MFFPEEISAHEAPQIVVGPRGPTGPVGPSGMSISCFMPKGWKGTPQNHGLSYIHVYVQDNVSEKARTITSSKLLH